MNRSRPSRNNAASSRTSCAVQGLINEEFERVMSGSPNESPNRMLAHMAVADAHRNGSVRTADAEMEEAAA